MSALQEQSLPPLRSIIRLRHLLALLPIGEEQQSFLSKVCADFIQVGLPYDVPGQYLRPNVLILNRAGLLSGHWAVSAMISFGTLLAKLGFDDASAPRLP